MKVRTLSLGPATVEITVKTTGEGEVKVELLDGETVIASASGEGRAFTLTAENVTPWSADTPQLYTCRVTYGEDEAVVPFGFRTLSWGKDGLLVNGKAEQWTGKTALVYLTYLGTPEERAEAEARAAEEKEKAEANAKLEKELQSYLPKEDAKKAIIDILCRER